jgi:putative aminopeptidase FrvX
LTDCRFLVPDPVREHRSFEQVRIVPQATALRILKEMLSIPTAPFAEHGVVDYVQNFCDRRRNITYRVDAYGNLLLRVRKGDRRIARPACLTAHLDHPGFVADRMIAKRRLRAHWRGGVPPEYFKGARVRFHVDGRWVRGTIKSVKTLKQMGRQRVDHAMINVSGEISSRSVGMWDLPEAKVRGSRIHARDCDDIAGAAAILSALDELDRGRKPVDAYVLLTRAEEVGFAGAIAAAKAKTVPLKCFLICMETSSERIHAKMGDGPILRVGDKISVFTPEVTAHCERVAQELARKNKRFKYQRKLMDGGTCESTAFCTYGYEATGICLALGNYHNVDTKRKRIAPEYIDLEDYRSVVKWFVEIARAPFPYTGRDHRLRTRLETTDRTYRKLLRSSLEHPR